MTMAEEPEPLLRGTAEEQAQAREIRRRKVGECEQWLGEQGAWLQQLDWDPEQPLVMFYLRRWSSEVAALKCLRQNPDARFWIAADDAEPWVLLDWELEQWRLQYLLRM